jgi:polygalacturonase
MANTYVDYTAVASQTDYNFSFEYLRDDHVKVKVDDVIVTNYTIVTSPVQLIRFNTAPTASATIKIYRDSRGDFSPLVDFVDGSVLTENELDESYKHNLFVSQESSEGTGGEQLTKKGLTNYDAEGNKIINLGSPTTATDAATKSYVDQTIDNAELVGGSPATVSLGVYDVTSTNDTLKQLRAWTADIETNASNIATNASNIATNTSNISNASNSNVTATGSTTARSLADRFGDVFNVKDFGAVGNGSDDDTSNIQAAITAAYDARTVSETFDTVTVFIPEGIYIVSSTITVPSYITLKGDGHNSVLKVKDSCTSGFNVLEISQNGANNINFNDFSIHGNSGNNTQVINGISIKPASGSVIYSNFNNLYIKECTGYAVETLNDGAERVRFNDCLFRDCKQHNVYSAKLISSSFNNCTIRTAKTGYSGVLLDGVNNKKIAFNHCLIEENAEYGIYSDRAVDLALKGCRIIANSNSGINILRTDTVNITDCQFLNNLGYGALLQGTSGDELIRVQASNNLFFANDNDGLYLDYCTASAITDNVFDSNSNASANTDSGLYAIRSTYLSILSNTFTGTSQRYGIELESTVTESFVYDNNIVEFGTGRLGDSGVLTRNKIEINRFGQSDAAPTAGSWVVGDIVWNNDPASGEYVGWICTVAGSPGTWKEFGLIQA